jgi:dihydrodipicolinate synthase/N-acetylneuraminate lyase
VLQIIGVKAAILRRKAVDLPWNPEMTVETIQSTVVEY